MKKKLISAGIIAAMSVSMLAGCGGDDANTVSIYVFGNDQEQALYTQLFKEFEEQNNCKVKAQFDVKDDYGQKLTGMMTAKKLPDVYYIGPESVSQYVDNGYALDIKPVLADLGLDTSDILQDILGMYEYKGGLYGLPHDSSVFAYAYNKDLFDKAGIPYPDPEKPYTYEEFVDVCKKLTDTSNPDAPQWGCGFANPFMFYQFVWSNGASFCSDDYKTVTVTDPKFVEALEKYAALTTTEKVTPTVEEDASLGVYNRWLAGQEAFYACGTWDIAAFMDKETFPFNWDLCAYPTLSTGKTATWCGTVGYAVNADTKKQELATKLAYFMSASQESMKLLSGLETGASVQIPNLVSMADGEFADAVKAGTLAYPEHYEVLFNYLNGEGDYTVNFMESTFTPNGEWLDKFFEGVDNVKNGSMTAKEYCEQVQPEMQKLLDNAWESVQ